MRVSATTSSPSDSGADTLAIGVFDGEQVAHDVKGGALQRLIDAGEGRTTFRHLAVAHAADRRWLIVGLGARLGLNGSEVVNAVRAELDTQITRLVEERRLPDGERNRALRCFDELLGCAAPR